MTEETPAVAIYHQGRRILATGNAVVTYGTPPLAIAVGSDVLIVPLDLYVPLRRADGSTVGDRSGPDSVAPGAPLVREFGGCTPARRSRRAECAGAILRRPDRADFVEPDLGGVAGRARNGRACGSRTGVASACRCGARGSHAEHLGDPGAPA